MAKAISNERYVPSQATESWVWSQFAKNWDGYAERHEPGIGAGDPDVWLLGVRPKHPVQRKQWASVRTGMVELKAPSKLDLRPAQWTWHERWQRMGGFVPIVTCDRWPGKARIRWMAYAPTFGSNSKRELVPMFLGHLVWPEFQAKLYRILNLYP